MSQIKKTSTELDWVFVDSNPILLEGIIALRFRISNPYYMKASLGDAKWQSPATGEYLPCTLVANQLEDLDNINLRAGARLVTVLWDAASDLRIMSAYPQITMVLNFWDRANQTGTKSALQSFPVPVDFTLQALGKSVTIVRPITHDPYFGFSFISPTLIRPGRIHLVLEVDSQETFDTPDYQSFNTGIDRTGWSADGEAFPEEGVDGAAVHKILLADPGLSALELGNWYFRVTPIVSQFRAEVLSPSSGQVFIGTTIEVSGSITYWDN